MTATQAKSVRRTDGAEAPQQLQRALLMPLLRQDPLRGWHALAERWALYLFSHARYRFLHDAFSDEEPWVAYA